MNDAKAIKKHAAQHDLFNRLHSIAADERFVTKVAQEWFYQRFEVIANQRCGTWYCDPATSSKAYAYFKSTDGHTLNWDFNLRRSNLSLATYAEDKGGFLLVDSTRRGKRMPDGLSKTVPIWCCVVNRACKLRREDEGDFDLESKEWDTSLYLPAIVSPSERSQIESRLDEWAEALESSVLPLPMLSKPLRPFFVHPSTSFPPQIPQDPPYTPIICVSASRWVNGDDGRGDPIPTATRVGGSWFGRTVTFDYVPGAGDDDELWGRGLTPSVYHKNKADLLSSPREDLPALVDELVHEAKDLSSAMDGMNLGAGTEPQPHAGPEGTLVAAAMMVDLGHTSQPPPVTEPLQCTMEILLRVFEVEKPLKDIPYVLPLVGGPERPVVVFAAPSARSHQKEYVVALGDVVKYLNTKFPSLGREAKLLVSPGSRAELNTAVALFRTTDKASVTTPSKFASSQRLEPQELQTARKTIIPIAVAILCSLPKLGFESFDTQDIDKVTIASCLHSLVALWPNGNPPRAALKRVNEFLMSA